MGRRLARVGFVVVVMSAVFSGTSTSAAYAVTSVGSCQDTVLFVRVSGIVAGVGLQDQTAPVKMTGSIARDITTGTVTPNAGSCAGTVTRLGDPHVPGGNNPTLTPKSEVVSLSGDASCANGAAAQAVDATAANAYPMNGKITWTFIQTYTDLVTGLPTHYKMQADVAVLGLASSTFDVFNVGGIVVSGADAGATIGGNIWEDPVGLVLPHEIGPTLYNTGYALDVNNGVLNCEDGTPGNVLIVTEMISGGGTHAVSPLGSTATGLTFQFGQ
jgi:hypothetical protein